MSISPFLPFILSPRLTCLLVPLTALLSLAAAKADPPEVRITRDVTYYQGKAADAERHKLDLYLPRDRHNFPVLVLIHGGAWVCGDKTLFGWGADIATFFARQGIGVVLPNYRLAPGVKYSDQAQDVARALAWTLRNIARYGGAADKLFLCGHSAGGHLAALVATDAAYLKAEKIKPVPIKGVIGVSGVYDIPEIKLDVALPRSVAGAVAARLPGLLPATDPPAAAKKAPAGMAGLQLSLNPFRVLFGNDPKERKNASPLAHVRAGLPPFLLIHAEHDLPLLPGMARQFAQALKAVHDDVQTLEVAQRNHESVMFAASTADDPVVRAMLKFIQTH